MIQAYSPKIIGSCCRWRSSVGANPHEPGEPDAVRPRQCGPQIRLQRRPGHYPGPAQSVAQRILITCLWPLNLIRLLKVRPQKNQKESVDE
jgi:hypothetical protein